MPNDAARIADLAAGGDARHRRELAVEVVLADVHDRQVEDLREVQALVEVAPGSTAPSPKNATATLPWRCAEIAGAGGGGDAAADDAEAADEPVLEVDHVHRARAAAADPGRAPEHLGRERLGVGALRERVAVAAVGAAT